MLAELHKRSETITSQINHLKNQRNLILEIEGIFFKYQIPKNGLDGELLYKLKSEDFTKIMEIMEEQNISGLTEQFNNHKQIMDLYKKIVADLGDVPDATQHEDSLKWFETIANVISKHTQSYQIDQTDNIKNLESSLLEIAKLINKFKIEVLTEPIFEMLEFNELLNKCGFGITEKAEIKKAIGQSNYNLVQEKILDPERKENLMAPYRDFYKAKKAMYSKDMEAVIEVCLNQSIKLTLENIEEQIDSLCFGLPEIPYKNIQNAVVCLLLEEEFKVYDEYLEKEYEPEFAKDFEKETAETCERLLAISRKHTPKEIKKLETNEGTQKINTEGENLLQEAKKIITEEYEFLQSITPDDKKRYNILDGLLNKFALSDDPSSDKAKYTLAFIVEKLRLETLEFEILLKIFEESPKEHSIRYKELFQDLKNYIETYPLAKKQFNDYSKTEEEPTEEKEERKIIYLTNNNEEAIVLDSLRRGKIPFPNLSNVSNIIEKLSMGIVGKSYKDQRALDFPVIGIPSDAITVTCIPIGQGTYLILSANQISNNVRKETARIIGSYQKKINTIIETIKKPAGLASLYDSQAPVRSSINEYLNSKNKTPKQ